MLNKNNKKVNTDEDDGGLLAVLWNDIVYKNSMESLLKYYLDRYKKKGGRRNKSTVLGYFTAPSLSWKSFIFIVLKVLPVKKVHITIELEFVNNEKSAHTITVTPKDIMDDKEVISSKAKALFIGGEIETESVKAINFKPEK